MRPVSYTHLDVYKRQEVCGLEGLDPEGIFTHFAVADEGNDGRGYTLMQLDLFLKLIDLLAQRGITFRLRHCANSAAVLDYACLLYTSNSGISEEIMMIDLPSLIKSCMIV